MSGIKHLIAMTVAVTLFAVYVLPPALLVLKLINWFGAIVSPTEEKLDRFTLAWASLDMLMLAWVPLVLITVILYRKRRLHKFLSTVFGPVDN